jgi:hypothetical protein
MLGMGDFMIFLAYALCILSALACVVYGIFNWNKGTDIDEPVEKEWEETERDIAEELDI